MAEETDNQPQAEELAQKTKRRLRANNETVRERTQRIGAASEVKLQKQSDGKRHPVASFFSGFLWPLRKLGQGIASLNRFKVFRIIGHILFPKYFRNSWRELRLVTWPNRSTSWRLTYAVIIFSVIFGVIIAIVDFALDKLFKEFIIK